MDTTDRFKRCLDYLFGLEGGFCNVQGDPGGRTIYGISEHSHPEAWVNGPPSKDAAAAIYWSQYWCPNKCDAFTSERVAKELLEAGVLCGPVAAAEFLQNAINLISDGITAQIGVDGDIGYLETIPAANLICTRFENAVVRAQNYFQAAYLVSGNQRKFNLGWFNRRLD